MHCGWLSTMTMTNWRCFEMQKRSVFVNICASRKCLSSHYFESLTPVERGEMFKQILKDNFTQLRNVDRFAIFDYAILPGHSAADKCNRMEQERAKCAYSSRHSMSGIRNEVRWRRVIRGGGKWPHRVIRGHWGRGRPTWYLVSRILINLNVLITLSLEILIQNNILTNSFLWEEIFNSVFIKNENRRSQIHESDED